MRRKYWAKCDRPFDGKTFGDLRLRYTDTEEEVKQAYREGWSQETRDIIIHWCSQGRRFGYIDKVVLPFGYEPNYDWENDSNLELKGRYIVEKIKR